MSLQVMQQLRESTAKAHQRCAALEGLVGDLRRQVDALARAGVGLQPRPEAPSTPLPLPLPMPAPAAKKRTPTA